VLSLLSFKFTPATAPTVAPSAYESPKVPFVNEAVLVVPIPVKVRVLEANVTSIALFRILFVPSIGSSPDLKLFNLTLSSAENTLLVKLSVPILKLNCPSVLLLGNVTLLVDSCSLAASSAAVALAWEPEVLSKLPVPPGNVPALKLFSLVLSSAEIHY
jgi:hypothetical protein